MVSLDVILGLIFCLVATVDCDVNQIVKHCNEEWCNSLDPSDAKYSSPEYHKKLMQFFSAGISQLIYEDAASTAANSNISAQCNSALRQVSQALLNGEEWAFRLLDASGKTPSAFIDGTVTSLGDYDQCLAISTDSMSPINGKYCLVDVFTLGYNGTRGGRVNNDKISLNKMRHFRDSAYYFSICLPSQCSSEDTRNLFKSVLQSLPLAVEGEISCDTAESNSWSSRLSNLRLISIAGLLYLSIIIGTVAFGTLCHLFQSEPSEVSTSVSVIENVHKLFWVKRTARADGFFSWFKLFIIFCGLAAHVMCCLESPLGFMMLTHHLTLENLMSNPALISLFGDSGIVCSTALSGFTTFMIAYPLALKNKMSITMFTLNKALRFLPSVLVIMSIDVLWYLPITGPFVTRVGQVILDKCTDTWWKSALFVNNLWGGTLQICAGHTYSLSVDVQLTLLGMVAILLLARKPILGFIYCVAFIALGNALMIYYSFKYNVPANLLVAHSPSIQEIEVFLRYIHMATSSYSPSYFASILVGYTVYHGWWNKYRSNHLLMLALISATSLTAQYLPILPNTLQLIPQAAVPYFIVINRAIVVIECACMFIYASHFESAPDGEKKTDGEEKEASKKKTDEDAAAKSEDSQPGDLLANDQDGHYSLLKGLFRSSFSIYMINYTYIRTDFFISRNLFYTSLYAFVKRLLTSLAIILPLAFMFHVIFVAPTVNLITLLMTPRPSKSKSRAKEE